MVLIAVAGGTGDVGKTVVQELVEQGKHEVVVLSRRPPDPSRTNTPKFVTVNYNDTDGLAKTLRGINAHTVISTLTLDGTGELAQLHLIAASGECSTVQRFIPSEFVVYTPDGDPDEADEMTAPILRARQALSQTRLESTHIAVGAFMDYFGQPNIPSLLRPHQWALDVPARRAVVPGTGNDIITLTYSRDLARYIARLVDDKDWPKFSNISGSDTCLNEIIALAESATGAKFHTRHDAIEDIQAGRATPISADAITYNNIDPMALATMMANGVIDGALRLPKENRLNDRYPDIVPLGIDELMKRAWSGK